MEELKEKSKRCPECGNVKPLSQYHTDKRRPDGKCGYCKECKNKKKQKWREQNKTQVNLKQIEYKRRKKKELLDV